jgi:hypothetical protein
MMLTDKRPPASKTGTDGGKLWSDTDSTVAADKARKA